MKFEEYAPEANKFLKEVAEELGQPDDTDHAYRVMKSVFHTMRDILTPEESLHLIAQLPLPIKGLYVDGWQLQVKDRIRSMPAFLQALREKSDRSAGRDFGNDETAKRHTKCVLNVVKRHVATGEVQHMIDQFPMELAELWLSDEKLVHR
jgi:uncharacterized protein (DUF2267 family)